MKRWTIDGRPRSAFCGTMVESTEGEYVLHSDVEWFCGEVLAVQDALRARIAELEDAAQHAAWERDERTPFLGDG